MFNVALVYCWPCQYIACDIPMRTHAALVLMVNNYAADLRTSTRTTTCLNVHSQVGLLLYIQNEVNTTLQPTDEQLVMMMMMMMVICSAPFIIQWIRTMVHYKSQ